MAARVYWITLAVLINGLSKYIGRYQNQLQANLTTEQWNCVNALLNALIECSALLPHNTPVSNTP